MPVEARHQPAAIVRQDRIDIRSSHHGPNGRARENGLTNRMSRAVTA